MYSIELKDNKQFNINIKYNEESYDTDSILQLIGLTGTVDNRDVQEVLNYTGILARSYVGEPRSLQNIKTLTIIDDDYIRIRTILIQSEYNELDLLKIEIYDKLSNINHDY